MKARNPLDTEPMESAAPPDAPPAPTRPPAPAPPPKPTPLPEGPPQWVELAAGRAVRTGPPPILPARRPIDLEPVQPHEETELAREQEAAAADAQLSRAYRAAHATVFTLVMGFFVSGAGMCVYVLVRH